MFLMYVLGFFITYVGLVILNKDSLIDHDVSWVIELYTIMMVLSAVFSIAWFVVPVILGTQWFLGLFKGRKNENV